MRDVVVAVKIWGRVAGYLDLDPQTGLCRFEYDTAFKQSGLELSPLMMPLSSPITVWSFPENRGDCFKYLPGVFADSLPDKFGNTIVDEWFESKGVTVSEISVLDRLCYVGKRGMGALEFEPSEKIRGLDSSTKVRVAVLQELAQRIFEDRKSFRDSLIQGDKSVADILKVGTSAGGAKAKALIAYNDITGEVRSGQVPAPEGFGYWLLKFDGTAYAEHDEIKGNPRGICNVEYAYYKMALDCGIVMNECRLLKDGEFSHFITKRFDRTDTGERLHMVSLAGMAHMDRDLPHSYDEIATILRRLHLDVKSVEQLFRRMVFNVLASNNDDHAKNFAFLMDKAGRWTFAPAFDMCYAYVPGGQWTGRHQMSVNGKRSGITAEDLLAVGQRMDVSGAKGIIDEIESVVSDWRQYASSSDVPEYMMEIIAGQISVSVK